MIRILSIDGGGLRGIIPLQILKYIESLTGRRIADSFDLIAGTSTGGILACGLTVSDRSSKQLCFSLKELEEIYLKDGKLIFPEPLFGDGWTSPKFSAEGLDTVLGEYFGDSLLSDCQKPVLISSYDLRSYSTYYFTSRFINPLSVDYDTTMNFALKTICRATSAAPTYLPSFPFKYLNSEQIHKQHNFIDGGIYVNNPSLAAISEVLKHNKDVLYNNKFRAEVGREIDPLKLDDIYLLSLGTGKTMKQITEKQGRRWGQLRWARPAIEIMMQGNSLSVHNQAKTLLGNKYLRIDIDIPTEELSDMSDSSDDTSEALLREVNQQVFNNRARLDEIARFVAAANL